MSDPTSPRKRLGLVLTALLVSTGVGLVATEVRAEGPFGTKKQFVITAEDLAGYQSEHRKYDNSAGREQQNTRTGLALVLQGGGAHLGFHYFVLPKFSLGGTLGYEARGGSNTMEDGAGTYSTELGSAHTLLVGLRAGYALMFTDKVGFWFRGGPGLSQGVRRPNDWSNTDKNVDTAWLISADVLFVVSPTPHFGLYLGPSGDLAFAGRHREVRNQPTPPVPKDWAKSASYQRLALGLGVFGYF